MDKTYTIKKIDNSSLEATITIPKDLFKKSYENMLEAESKKNNIKGFRKGKTPKELIENKLKPEIMFEAFNRLAPMYVQKAVSEEKLEIVATPIFKEMPKLELEKEERNKLRPELRNLSEKVKELQVFMYDTKGKMGAIIISTELLRDAIDSYEEFEKAGIKDAGAWKVSSRLQEVADQLEKVYLDSDDVSDIERQFSRLSDKKQFETLVVAARSKIKFKRH